MNFDDIINKIKSLEDVSDNLLNTSIQLFTQINKQHKGILTVLNINNIYKSYKDEISVEWMNNNNYVFLKIRENECRVEARTDEGRFTKFHPVCFKIIPALVQNIEKIK